MGGRLPSGSAAGALKYAGALRTLTLRLAGNQVAQRGEGDDATRTGERTTFVDF